MTSRWRWGRMLRLAGVAVLALVCGLVGFVQVQQHILRWRAERLLADIRAIQMGKSSWADAQQLMYRWGKWGGWERDCSARSCDYQITIQDALHAFPVYIIPNRTIRQEANARSKFLYRPYYLFGGRFAGISARIQVKDGVIWTKSFDVDILEFPHLRFEDPENYALLAAARGVTNNQHSELSDRRELVVSRPVCTGCEMIRVDYTPFAEPAAVDQLLDFRLSCLTRIPVCHHPSELMPTAWNAYGTLGYDVPTSTKVSDQEKLESSGRDTQFAAIAQVTKTNVTREKTGPVKWATFRLVQGLKGGVPSGLEVSHWQPAEQVDAELKRGGIHSGLKPGDNVIVLFEIRPDRPEPDNINNERYELVACTRENLAAITRGIARDKLAEVP